MNTRKRFDSPPILFSQGTTYSKNGEPKYDKFETSFDGKGGKLTIEILYNQFVFITLATCYIFYGLYY